MEEKLLIAVLPLYDGDNTVYMPIEDYIDWKNVEEYIRNNLQDMKGLSIKFVIRNKKWFENLKEIN